MAAPETPDPTCSAKGCAARGVWVLAWNNPKIHEPARRKAWIACEAHREHLTRFLDSRGFLKATVPVDEWAGEDLPASS